MNVNKTLIFKNKKPPPAAAGGGEKRALFGNRVVACDTQSAVQRSLGSYFVCPDVKTASVNTLLEQSAAELLAPIICHARANVRAVVQSLLKMTCVPINRLR